MREKAQQNSSTYLLLEKILIEQQFDWLKCLISKNELLGKGHLHSTSSGKQYQILVQYSYFNPNRFERIWVIEPKIKFNIKTHMYVDNSLCLYFPKDLPDSTITPLATILPWVSEWLVKYEFWQRYKVWIGDEAPH